jgi:DNA-binding NtrC family response regulator
MPELSGRELLKYIQARHPATPVIVISGMSDEADGRALIEAGAFAYFAKPFKLEEIEEAVERAIARHQKLLSENQA